MDDYNYSLVYLTEGDDLTLVVTTPRATSIQELRRLIYEERGFNGVDIHELDLFKVCDDLSAKWLLR